MKHDPLSFGRRRPIRCTRRRADHQAAIAAGLVAVLFLGGLAIACQVDAPGVGLLCVIGSSLASIVGLFALSPEGGR